MPVNTKSTLPSHTTAKGNAGLLMFCLRRPPPYLFFNARCPLPKTNFLRILHRFFERDFSYLPSGAPGMFRSGNQLISLGCRVGRNVLNLPQPGVSPLASQPKLCLLRGQGPGQVGRLLSRRSMTFASAHRGGGSRLGVTSGAAVSSSMSRGSLPFGAGGSKRVMYVFI